jgi:hypothetical protein
MSSVPYLAYSLEWIRFDAANNYIQINTERIIIHYTNNSQSRNAYFYKKTNPEFYRQILEYVNRALSPKSYINVASRVSTPETHNRVRIQYYEIGFSLGESSADGNIINDIAIRLKEEDTYITY